MKVKLAQRVPWVSSSQLFYSAGVMSVRIIGKFHDLVEESCPARWRVHQCKNSPTEWAVFWSMNDKSDICTCLSKYCKDCRNIKPPKMAPGWVWLSDEDAADLILQSKVYEVQEQ